MQSYAIMKVIDSCNKRLAIFMDRIWLFWYTMEMVPSIVFKGQNFKIFLAFLHLECLSRHFGLDCGHAFLLFPYKPHAWSK